ncbi:short-chain dehydrogenase/reductase SDR [Caballeronia udeis]|uniref:Short-chain dehydrogenase/reductase SDR n=1 Tax=Caballeronia udeis TaxID=1232866 RepID=A0A158K1W7_9BURK|nr:short-chain dehydrogenase/reductase SDR [Caballeronia udeis]
MQKTWFITGAGRGLGAAIAKAALRAGERVVATARNLGAITGSVAIRRCDMICADKTNPIPDETDPDASLSTCI